MAPQMAAALAAAFTVGHAGFGEHWPWVVLTAFIVHSGNRGRLEVAYKSLLRLREPERLLDALGALRDSLPLLPGRGEGPRTALP